MVPWESSLWASPSKTGWYNIHKQQCGWTQRLCFRINHPEAAPDVATQSHPEAPAPDVATQSLCIKRALTFSEVNQDSWTLNPEAWNSRTWQEQAATQLQERNDRLWQWLLGFFQAALKITLLTSLKILRLLIQGSCEKPESGRQAIIFPST